MGRIVVGVDGSEHSRRALQWAYSEARLRGDDLHAVHVWSLPIMTDATAPALAGMTDALGQEAESILESAIEEAGIDRNAGVVVKAETMRGPAAASLLRASAEADLLVVGSRGRGGFAGLLLGSVSQQCVHHPPCPVVIVP